MLAKILDASFNNDTGQVDVALASSTACGYQNLCQQYITANTISVPKTNIVANIEKQSLSQVMVTGYNSILKDFNFTIAQGEHTSFSSNWYLNTKNSGINVQEANTSNIENYMMGQSTNSVLSDVLNLLVEIITYLGTHTHSGVQSGGDTSDIPVQTVPDDSVIVADKTYISANKNLAITGVYTPK